MAARKIQTTWRLFKSKSRVFNDSVLEETSIIIDYSFRNEKLFNFT